MKDYIPSRQIPRALFLTKHVLSGKVMLELNEMRKRYNEAMRSIRDAINGRIRPLGGRGLPLVTVCILTRNEERFIGQAIYSITHSQYRNTEVIVVDGMSSDKTRDIAKRLGARVIELDVVGNVGLPRHICSLEARGEVIVQIDADTVLTPYVITRTVTTLINGKAMIYHVAHYYYDGNTIMNLIAHYYDKYFRKPWNTTGHFIAYTQELYKHVQFDIKARIGEEDYGFGEKAYKKFGSHVFKFDRETIVLVSGRGYKRQGLTNNINYIFRTI
ncbi:glycosyltransferase family 2 protein [Vulcanisaeta souniana]|uniref:Glycosyltransferase 2-like domain-containing protein n=1 Tax=Vulcanisaeta souniana JCM 11219 TaxID=1293586 RepID=A0A830EH43_9CREN|nr:glycosyltransferase [Vulcanisaeta souniana]BDR92706.1 hypothetical protein Vsou_17990 [Vulcanisaeta souniana JCM 11219]GGI84278.1 hypothetical protein GCM10007112_21510 [Vulcanisaeta souniana JCM 11219]